MRRSGRCGSDGARFPHGSTQLDLVAPLLPRKRKGGAPVRILGDSGQRTGLQRHDLKKTVSKDSVARQKEASVLTRKRHRACGRTVRPIGRDGGSGGLKISETQSPQGCQAWRAGGWKFPEKCNQAPESWGEAAATDTPSPPIFEHDLRIHQMQQCS